MKKNIFLSVLILALLFLFSSCAENTGYAETEPPVLTTTEFADDESSGTPYIVVGQAETAAGETVDIPVLIENNSGIAGALLEFRFDEKLALKNAKSGDAFAVLDFTQPGKFENPCKFCWDSESGMATENGNILLLTFKVSEDVQPGEKLSVDCSYKIGDVYDEDLNDVDLQIQNGNISIIKEEK